MSPTQLGGFYFLNSNNLIGFKVGVDREGEERQTNITSQYKHYVGNSFYVAGEVFYLHTREKEEIKFFRDAGTLSDKRELAEYSSLGVGVRIGNQWTWENLTIGCDWIGLGQRVGIFKKESSKLDNTTFTLINVIIGVSF
jgi:hypothetical protein